MPPAPYFKMPLGLEMPQHLAGLGLVIVERSFNSVELSFKTMAKLPLTSKEPGVHPDYIIL